MLMPDRIHRGKVRDTYPAEDPDSLIVVTTDRISAFDVIMGEGVPGKGRVLSSVTEHWLTDTPVADIMPNHFISSEPEQIPEWVSVAGMVGRTIKVRRLNMLPVEAIVRGYLTGSGLKDYQETGKISGIELPSGFQQMQHFEEPIFTPSTKAEVGHDEPIDFEQTVEIIGSQELAEQVRDRSLKIYKAGAKYAMQRGIILIDTKFEFGLDPQTGELVLADEVLTPDSSRYMREEDYELGKPPVSMDKQILRDYLDSIHWDRKPPAPPISNEIIRRIQIAYAEIERRLMSVSLTEQA